MSLYLSVLRRIAAVALLSLIPFLSGCISGFAALAPGENSALYRHLFDDVITDYDEPYWLWVRGTSLCDLDGDGNVSEEAVIATIQKGTVRAPGPIEMAFLVAARVGPDGQRQAIARHLLFDSSPIPGAPKPENDLGRVVDKLPTRCRAQIMQDKASLKETVVVYFWADPLPASVWYAGFSLDNGALTKNLETVMWQDTPGFLVANLDRSIEAGPFGYQLIFGVAALPADVMRKFPDIGQQAPRWGHVFARNAEGRYVQADARFGAHYRQISPAWDKLYLKATLQNLPAEDLAWFEYHMALLNRYAGDRDMAAALLRKAEAGAEDPVLRAAVSKAGR